jgi:SWI/SNF-related matrix-associated actin-dependent regulator 1 of chromatin subfamily A
MVYTLTPNCYKVCFVYHPLLVACIKRIPSARFRADGRFWEVSPFDKKYLEVMADWAVKRRLCNSVQWATDEEPVESYEVPDMPKLTVPHNMTLEPYEYQKEGIAYALEKKRCIMGDEPGLGKTAQAIGTMTASGAWPALVICPASLKVNWQREFMKFGGVQAIILSDDNRTTWQQFWKLKNQKGEPLAKVFITNYESLKKYFVKQIRNTSRFTLKSVVFDERIELFRSVIIDESHKCKSSKTQQSKFVQGIAAGKEFVLELTGTPVVNNNTDLVQQLRIMERLEDFGGYTKFVDRYCAGETQSSHLKELNYYLNKFCFFRRQKKDVLKWLPEKTRSYLVVDIENRKEYDEAKRDVIKYLKEFKQADDEKLQRAIRGAVMVQMGVLKQISSKGKIKAAIDIIHNIIDGGEKLIVFCFLKQVVSDLKSEFPRAVTVTGDDDDRAKQHSVDSFQNDPRTNLIILNYRSGGTGLTLTAASNVLFIEFPWTYSDCCQAEDRAHRNGQKNAVTCTYLLGKDTIDEYMYELIQTKKDIANGVTGTIDNVEEKKVSTQQMLMEAALDIFKGNY